MSMNLVLATGVACSVGGALFMLVAHRAIRNAATRLVVAYPRKLDRRRVQRQDHRFGFGMLTGGGILQALAVFGYSAPLSLWRYPAGAAIAAVVVYRIWRFAAVRRKATPRARASSQKPGVRGTYETPRSITLLAAAQIHSANLHAREAARDPRDKGVVYLSREWDRRWWSDKLGVSTDVIKAAIREVGPMSRDVERRLAVQGANARPWPPDLERWR